MRSQPVRRGRRGLQRTRHRAPTPAPPPPPPPRPLVLCHRTQRGPPVAPLHASLLLARDPTPPPPLLPVTCRGPVPVATPHDAAISFLVMMRSATQSATRAGGASARPATAGGDARTTAPAAPTSRPASCNRPSPPPHLPCISLHLHRICPVSRSDLALAFRASPPYLACISTPTVLRGLPPPAAGVLVRPNRRLRRRGRPRRLVRAANKAP